MKEYLKHKTEYIKKIERCMTEFKKTDSKWIKRRNWYNDLRKFDLGESFFEKVFQTTSSSPPDKIVFWKKFLEPMTDKHEYQATGFTIDRDTPPSQQEDHESLLGYLWWIEIYNTAKRKKQFTADEIMELEYRRKYLFRKISEIEKSSRQGILRYRLRYFLFLHHIDMHVFDNEKYEKSDNKKIYQGSNNFPIKNAFVRQILHLLDSKFRQNRIQYQRSDQIINQSLHQLSYFSCNQ